MDNLVTLAEPQPIPRPSAPLLQVRDLKKSYGDVIALSCLDFDLHRGEVLGLVGANGAGKTTSLMCMAGLVRPDAGSVTIGGSDMLRGHRAARQQLALATQRPALYPVLSVEANLRFRAELAQLSREELDEYVAWASDLFALGPLLPKTSRHLSVGQQHLVHVAAALVHRPALVLVDEPTAGLDVIARGTVLRALRTLADEGAAVVFSSHSLSEVEELCDRVVILSHGAVVGMGPVADLVREHGGGRIEFEVEGEVVTMPGDDLVDALGALAVGTKPTGARVVAPSLEAVFLTLTGMTLTEAGEASR